MALKSILEIDVNDSSFKAFQAQFERYQEALSGLPGIWSDVAKGTGSASKAFDQLVTKAGGQLAAAKLQALAQGKAAELMRKADYEALSRQQKFLTGLRQADVVAGRMADQFVRASTATAKTASHITGSTVQLLKWASITGTLSALLGAGGGLFGIERLAARAASDRRASMGSGVSIGKRSAFSLDFGRFVDADSMLGNVSAGLSDQTSKQFLGLRGAGISSKYATTHDAADVSVEFLHRLPDLFKGVAPSLVGAVAEARGLTSVISTEDIKRYLAASPEERAKQEQAYRSDSRSLDVNGATSRAWQDLVTQLQRAGSQIETTFITGLVPLSGPLGDLSKGVTDLVAALLKSDTVKTGIESVAGGLEEFSKYVGTDKFKQDVRDFANGVANVAQKIRDALQWLGLIPKTDAEKAKDAGLSDSDASVYANNQGALGNAVRRGRQGLARQEHNAQSYQDRVTGKLNAFRGTNGWWTPERQSHAVDVLMEKAGLTETGAKALVSRWKNVESTGAGPNAANASGHRGIAQWDRARQAGMGSSFDEQLQHAADELNGPEGKAKHYLNEFGMAGVGASMFERGEGYDPKTGRDNFTDKTTAGIAGVVHGADAIAAARAAGSGPGSTGPGDVVSRAQGMVGFNEGQAAKALGHIMHAGEWCADFVNGTIEANGGKGSGSAMARSFMNWGHAVGIGAVKRGDVAVLNNGGHVGFFTGERDKNGRLGVIAGNTRDGRGGHDVEHYFVDPNSVLGARRGEEDTAQTASNAGVTPHQHLANMRRVLAARQGRAAPWQKHDFKAAVQAARTNAMIQQERDKVNAPMNPQHVSGLGLDKLQRRTGHDISIYNASGADVAMTGGPASYG